MVRSSTDPILIGEPERNKYRDDPRYRETGKEYGDWPAYPEWQDMPLRRFGNGYGKKGVQHAGAHFKPGGLLEEDQYGCQTQHGDSELVDGIARGIGHGRRKYDIIVTKDHFGSGCIPADEEAENNGGRQHFRVKDHMNDDCSTDVSSSRASRNSRRDSSCTEGSSRSSGTASRPRSSR